MMADAKPERLYLSGPMTGLPDNNAPAFDAAASALRAAGHEVVSPVEVGDALWAQFLQAELPTLDAAAPDWHDYMRADIKALCDCTTLVLLPGWHDSPGSHIELQLAHRLRLAICTLQDALTHPARRRGQAEGSAP